MTVFVDDMYKSPMGRFSRMKMSHMVADTEEELHAMAKAIGIDQKWYQKDHYDICLSKRNLAIQLGAKAITMRELAVKWREIRTERIKSRLDLSPKGD